jgi:hypothetical protein
MKETFLKKEFSKREVQRMRNLITGNSGDRTQILSGYEKAESNYKEGEVWQDIHGRSWTIKNGIKQTHTRLDKFKKLALMPIKCPKCSSPMKLNDLNKKMFKAKGVCFDCVIEEEHELRAQGKYKEYESEQMTANKNESLKDFEQALESWYNEKEQFFTESGEKEEWSQGDKTKTYEQIKEKIEELKNLKL